MTTILKNALLLINGNFFQRDLAIVGGKIADIGENLQGDTTIDLVGKKVLPGFIDTHTHGGNGYDVNLSSAQELGKISAFFAQNGTTLWLASVLTDEKVKTLEIIQNINAAMDIKGGARLFGIHLEGPFLNEKYKGAMPAHLLLSGDISLFEEYQEAARGNIKYMTVSPEVDGVIDMIKKLSGKVNIGIGHSGADFATAMSAIDAGANVATHTFNAMSPLHHHQIGIAGAALLSDIWCEAILDGLHLSPPMLSLLLKTKGYDRVIGVTDSIMAAGLSDGEYKLGVNDVVVKNRDARLKVGDARAGSTLTCAEAIKNLVKFIGEPLEKVSQLMSENPAKALGIFEACGSIAKGKYADLVVLDENLEVVMTICQGEIVFEKASNRLI